MEYEATFLIKGMSIVIIFLLVSLTALNIQFSVDNNSNHYDEVIDFGASSNKNITIKSNSTIICTKADKTEIERIYLDLLGVYIGELKKGDENGK